jgi:hypothetical protein
MLEQLGRTETPAKIAERKLRESELIALVSALVRELHPQRRDALCHVAVELSGATGELALGNPPLSRDVLCIP